MVNVSVDESGCVCVDISHSCGGRTVYLVDDEIDQLLELLPRVIPESRQKRIAWLEKKFLEAQKALWVETEKVNKMQLDLEKRKAAK